MPKLILLRHAHAEPLQHDDESRPLAELGRKECGQVAQQLAADLAGLDQAVVSPALRTVQTWQLVSQAADCKVQSRIDPRIYDASAGELLAIVNELESSNVALVGHNQLQIFKPGSSAVLESDLPWSDWEPGCAQLVRISTPGDPD